MAQIKALGLEPRNIGWSVSVRVDDDERGAMLVTGRLIGVEQAGHVVGLLLEGYEDAIDVKPGVMLTAYPPVTQSILTRVQEALEELLDGEEGA